MRQPGSPVIGLEIHVQVATESKLFCACSTDYIGAVPNTHVCPVCLGQPGSLPVINGRVVEYAVRTALALGARVGKSTRFHRKNYFYPDLPKAYQISQYDRPLAEGGALPIGEGENRKEIPITRLHLEEDAGKLVHSAADGRLGHSEYSLVDYNRGGVPLMEIVSEPEISTPAEAREYVATLRQLVRYLGVSDGDMEKGSLRVDANVSLTGADGKLGTKVEIKNMNSLRALERALDYEIARQADLIRKGESVRQETRHWDDGNGLTCGTRGKEEAHDYRYFPEPDLPALVLPDGFVEKQRDILPEMPWILKERFVKDWGLSLQDAAVLTELPGLSRYVEDCVREGADPQRAANWIRTEVLRVLNEKRIGIEDFGVPAENLSPLLVKIDRGELSTTLAKTVFDRMVAEGLTALEALEKIGAPSGRLTGERLRNVIERVLEKESSAVEEIKSGKDPKGKKRGFLCGQIMREARGQADPEEVAKTLSRFLGC
ncbi:MAG: Asp-tRNA(Asn)/Glu-tRNA(Gln) amidotransferase subunit GatB [Synergistales bacterium]